MTGQRHLQRPPSLRDGLRVSAVALGALHAWHGRRAMNPDGLSYLDAAEAFSRGGLIESVNALWSPLYSWLLGAALSVRRPQPGDEIYAVHFVNFVAYLCALVCFEFLLRELILYQEARGGGGGAGLPRWAWDALGYALFLVASLRLVNVSLVAPDMLVAAFVYVAAGCVLRARRGAGGWRTFALLGFALGLGYLAKAAVLPPALVFLFAAALRVGGWRTSLARASLALAVFLALACLYVVPLSLARGRLTFGESARLNYAWYINGATLHAHWRGAPPGSGAPAHPTRKIFDAPAAYEFATPVRATYAPWYDPAYWHEGLEARFDAWGHARALRTNAAILFHVLSSHGQAALFAGLIALLVLRLARGGGRRSVVSELSSVWPLLLPASAALAMFSLVHLEARYAGPFVVLLWLACFSAVRLPEGERERRPALLVIAAVLLLSAASLAPPTLAAARDVLRGEDLAGRAHWQVAEALESAGVRPGDGVASVGYAFDALWARLARVRIVAEITAGSLEAPTGDAEMFWAADSALKAEVLGRFAGVGAKAVVANRVPEGAATDGWQRVGDTGYYVRALDR